MNTTAHVPVARDRTPVRPPALAAARLAANVVMERLSRTQRRRLPEPMVMDEPASVAAFHTADPLLQLPVYRFNALAMSALLPEGGSVLDLGSGSGRLLAHLAQARPDIQALGTDLADNMLAAGRACHRDDGLAERVELRKADITQLPPDLPSDVDLVSTIWALHHLPTEADLHRCLSEIARIRDASGCAVWIFDFARLRRDATFEAIVAMNPHAPARLREDGIASERAAWSAGELRDAFKQVGLDDLRGGLQPRIGSLQAYFVPRRDGWRSAHPARWSAPELPLASQLMYRRVCAGIPTPAASRGEATGTEVRGQA
jgi:tRNA (cmo5U34)-methyltransferase